MHYIWQVVGSVKANIDSGTLMESEVKAGSIAHLQQVLLSGLKSEFEFTATVFGSAAQVEMLKFSQQNELFQKLKGNKNTDLSAQI